MLLYRFENLKAQGSRCYILVYYQHVGVVDLLIYETFGEVATERYGVPVALVEVPCLGYLLVPVAQFYGEVGVALYHYLAVCLEGGHGKPLASNLIDECRVVEGHGLLRVGET